jgi:hypothetical protein
VTHPLVLEDHIDVFSRGDRQGDLVLREHRPENPKVIVREEPIETIGEYPGLHGATWVTDPWKHGILLDVAVTGSHGKLSRPRVVLEHPAVGVCGDDDGAAVVSIPDVPLGMRPDEVRKDKLRPPKPVRSPVAQLGPP